MKIGKYIGELLYEHDCVIVTEFGGFVAQYHSATIHPVQHTFSPPSKSIAFNQNLVKNDGLLANYISNKLLLSYPDACRVINDFVIICNSELERGNKVIIENIGELFYDYEKNLQFIPASQTNYLLDSFGLTDIQSPAIKREKDFDIFNNSDHSVVPATRRKSYLKPVLKIAAITGVAAMLTWAYFNPVISGKISKSLAGIFPEMETSTSINEPVDAKVSEAKPYKESVATNESQPVEDIYQKPIEESPVATTENANAVNTVTSNTIESPKENIEPVKNITPEIKNVIVTKPSVELSSNSNDKYFIIGGCFSIAENATKLNNELKVKGFPSQLLGKGKRGLEMVSISSAGSREKAEEMLGFIQTSGYPDAWIMRK